MTHLPRSRRNAAHFDRVFIANRIRLGAIAAAELAITASFGQSYRINTEKLALERAMSNGAGDPFVRSEYGWIAERCPSTLAASIVAVERLYRSEVRERQQRQSYGLPLHSMAREERMGRARLFLRWYRRFADQDRHPFFWLRDAMTTSPAYSVEAAE